jgi:hypothetical protein
MADRLTIESVVADFVKDKQLCREKSDFLLAVFRRLKSEGDFTKDFGTPPGWIQDALGSWEYKNCTWGHCVCDVLVAMGLSTEDDPLEAPYEFLGAESIWTDEEIEAEVKQRFEDWDALTGAERLKRFRNTIKPLSRY